MWCRFLLTLALTTLVSCATHDWKLTIMSDNTVVTVRGDLSLARLPYAPPWMTTSSGSLIVFAWDSFRLDWIGPLVTDTIVRGPYRWIFPTPGEFCDTVYVERMPR